MKPLYVSGRLYEFIESLAASAANSKDPDASLPMTLYFMGSRAEFFAQLPREWYRTHGPALTEAFTDSVDIVFTDTAADLVAKVYSETTASRESGNRRRVLVWGLLSHLKSTKPFYESSFFNVHKLSNLLYMVLQPALAVTGDRPRMFMFGDSMPGKTAIDLLPDPAPAQATTVPEPGARPGQRAGTATIAEQGITGVPLKGSLDDPLTVNDVLAKWFHVVSI